MHPSPTARPVDPDGAAAARPLVSVVLCTYNRADRLEATVRAILAQESCDFELVVVDDGSRDATPDVLAAIADDRLRVVRRPNGGLSAARNSGLAAATGRWLVFADDDDVPEAGWLQTLMGPTADPRVGITQCGGTFVDPTGAELGPFVIGPVDDSPAEAFRAWLPGTFAVRADLVHRAGGYLPGLGVSHQTELLIRALATARAEGLAARRVGTRALRIERRPPADRPLANPRLSYDGTRWVLARHPGLFAAYPAARARYEGIVGTGAARLGDWRAARRHFARALHDAPASRANWGRVALAAVPPVGRRFWDRHGAWASHDPAEIGVARQRRCDPPTERELFLPWRYRQNPERDGGGASPGPLPGPAGAAARRLARRRRWSQVVAVGPDGNVIGAGDGPARPDLVVCADALHRVDDPVALLHRLADVAAGGPVLVSTPDRARTDPDRPLGPPRDPTYRRQWSPDELELLLHSTGFDVERAWRRWRRPARRAGSDLVVLVRERRPRAG